jgi:hypothetical protein
MTFQKRDYTCEKCKRSEKSTSNVKPPIGWKLADGIHVCEKCK